MGEDKTSRLDAIGALMRRVDSARANPDSKVLEFRRNIFFGVVGVSSSARALPADLRHRISVQGSFSSRRLKRIVVIAGVDKIFQPLDFLALSMKFGGGFDHFLLLNDVAVEACRAAGVHHPIRGYIRENELTRPGIILTCPYWS
jgi:hypothetical protein